MRLSRSFDPRLMLVTDGVRADSRRIETIVASAARGGVTSVQLREKNLSDEDLVRIALGLIRLLEPYRVPLLINDRIGVAASAGAAGVHLGQQDASVDDARRVLGPGAVIGLSVGTPAQADAARGLDLDYLGVSPVFETPTKPDAGEPWGLAGLRELRRRTDRVLVAIGGIGAANGASVLAAGADGLAVVSAICSAADPEAAARDLRALVDAYPGQGRRGP
jgi:thiamine-phosphate pyrophosphorylase